MFEPPSPSGSEQSPSPYRDANHTSIGSLDEGNRSMAAPDPSWKDAFNYLWAVVLIPVAALWRKVDGAASKEELETHRKEDRENFRQLFQNAEEDRTVVREGFQSILKEMHDAENRLRDKIDAK